MPRPTSRDWLFAVSLTAFLSESKIRTLREIPVSSGHDLNSLSRFRKQSGRLVLEEHGHCEVPAGCGGVVLRWRNPNTAVPLILHLYTPVPAKCFLDGAEVQTSQVDLAPGRHAIGFAIQNLSWSQGLIMFAAVHRNARTETSPSSSGHALEFSQCILTKEDGTWKYTVQEPPDDWKESNFDDRNWSTMSRLPAPQLSPGAPGDFQSRECLRQGADFLGIGRYQERAKWWERLLGIQKAAPTINRIWIRKVFDIRLSHQRDV
jgi:hypothetical protein